MSALAASEQQSRTKRPLSLSPPPLPNKRVKTRHRSLLLRWRGLKNMQVLRGGQWAPQSELLKTMSSASPEDGKKFPGELGGRGARLAGGGGDSSVLSPMISPQKSTPWLMDFTSHRAQLTLPGAPFAHALGRSIWGPARPNPARLEAWRWHHVAPRAPYPGGWWGSLPAGSGGTWRLRARGPCGCRAGRLSAGRWQEGPGRRRRSSVLDTLGRTLLVGQGNGILIIRLKRWRTLGEGSCLMGSERVYGVLEMGSSHCMSKYWQWDCTTMVSAWTGCSSSKFSTA